MTHSGWSGVVAGLRDGTCVARRPREVQVTGGDSLLPLSFPSLGLNASTKTPNLTSAF